MKKDHKCYFSPIIFYGTEFKWSNVNWILYNWAFLIYLYSFPIQKCNGHSCIKNESALKIIYNNLYMGFIASLLTKIYLFFVFMMSFISFTLSL